MTDPLDNPAYYELMDACRAVNPGAGLVRLTQELRESTDLSLSDAYVVASDYLRHNPIIHQGRAAGEASVERTTGPDGIARSEEVAAKVGVSDLVGCLMALSVFAVLGALGWVFIRTLFTPPPSEGLAKPESPAWNLFQGTWTIGLIALFAWYLLRGKAQPHFPVFRRITPLIVVQNMGVILVVGAVAFGLLRTFPFLDRSWLYLIARGNDSAGNIVVLPIFIRFVGPVFLAMFALNVPALAYDEECSYRKGTRDWQHGFRRSLRFGLGHCLMGVPIFAGLALTIGGLWFTHQYFQGGVERSTVHHTAYNLIVLAVLTLALML